MAMIIATIARLRVTNARFDARLASAERIGTGRLAGSAGASFQLRPTTKQDRRADEREQHRRAKVSVGGVAAAGQPLADRNGAERDRDRGERAEQHAHAGDECPLAAVLGDPRGHRQIRDVDRRISGAEQQMADEDAGDAPGAGGQRRHVGEHEGEAERDRADDQQPAIAALAAGAGRGSARRRNWRCRPRSTRP